jgi:predicted RNase H-like nuclease (RuvC/YqgF family)
MSEELTDTEKLTLAATEMLCERIKKLKEENKCLKEANDKCRQDLRGTTQFYLECADKLEDVEEELKQYKQRENHLNECIDRLRILKGKTKDELIQDCRYWNCAWKSCQAVVEAAKKVSEYYPYLTDLKQTLKDLEEQCNQDES